MSPRKSKRRSSSKPRGPFRGPWVFVLGLVLLAAAAWIEGPVVVRQVTSRIGMKRVEAHAERLRAAARESGMDPCLLAGLVYVESRGRVDAVSSVGAMGLFQLMPAAASDAAQRLKLPPPTRAALLSDAELNARLGANHLKRLFELLGPDPERVLVAYNAGRGRLLEWEAAAGGWAAWRAKRVARGDSQTLAYAEDVLAFAARFRERGVIVETGPRSAGLGLSSEVGGAEERAGASLPGPAGAPTPAPPESVSRP